MDSNRPRYLCQPFCAIHQPNDCLLLKDSLLIFDILLYFPQSGTESQASY